MRVAHLSDVHLLSISGTSLVDYLNKRWLGGVNVALNRGKHHSVEVFDALVADANQLGVEQIVCTGDLTNLALKSEFEFARERFAGFARGPEHVSCIPGNHDAYVAESEGRFERLFADYCTSDPGWEAVRGDGVWPMVRVRGDVAIIGLSSSRPAPIFFAHGELGEEQLLRLARVLTDPRLADKLRLVLVHHPPAGPYTKKWARHLRDHEKLARVIEKTGAELVLHGHEHLNLSATLAGPAGASVPVLGIQSGSYDPGPQTGRTDKAMQHAESHRARYRVLTVERRGPGRPVVVGQELRAWSAGERRFVAEDAADRVSSPAA
jgi:3',5'-cyclic AMP phosphodiesterase CpdA